MRIDNKKIVPIVFATNNNFAPYTGVAIQSIIEHSCGKNNYHIYILYNELCSEYINVFEKMKTDNLFVQCINVNSYISGMSDFQSLHLTQETVYRLIIPDIFEQYDKIIYLDGDIIVKDDISDFYNNDIDSYVIGAIREVPCNAMEKYYLTHHSEVFIESAFNAGVLLININEFIKQKIKEKCLKLLEDDFSRTTPLFNYLDQDVLNITCKDKVKFLDPLWNIQIKFMFAGEYNTVKYDFRETLINLSKKAKILHFAGSNKPWNLDCLTGADEFWEIAVKTNFYNEIKKRFICFKEKMINSKPLKNIKKDSNIILYGAGGKGRELREIIVYEKHCNIILWVDKYASNSFTNYDIHLPNEICNYYYDNVVIAIENETIAQTVINELISIGIVEEKIIWAFQ